MGLALCSDDREGVSSLPVSNGGQVRVAPGWSAWRNVKVGGDSEVEYHETMAAAGRSLHWVIRNSDLKPSMAFFEKVLGIVSLRHEENKEPCEITCNGRYNNAWSKTMCGVKDRSEDIAYALEVTYNYGVKEYERGNGFMRFGMLLKDPKAALKAAEEMKFDVADDEVTGPDGYKYQLLQAPEDRKEVFGFIQLQVKELKRSVEFYTKTLGMSLFKEDDLAFKAPEKSAVVGFPATEQCEGVPLVLVESGKDIEIQEFDGRHAVEMPEKKIREVYAELEKNNKDLIVHEIRTLKDKLGDMAITIIKDLDGFEICLVSSETFPKLAKAATDYKGPNYDERRKYIDSKLPPKRKGESS